MMYYEITNNNINELCVICVDKKVLDLEGTVVSDRNAAAEFAYIDTPQKVLRQLDFGAVKARYWNDDNYTVYAEKKAKKCAEVLLLNKIPIKYLIKIKVATALAKENAKRLHLSIPVEVDKDLFFQ